MRKYTTRSAKETMMLAGKLVSEFTDGGVLALVGKLGAGKTVFVKGLAKGLGIGHLVQSPTFILMNVYPVKKRPFNKLVHVDCYRLDNAQDLHNIGLDEYLRDKKALVAIEWAEKVQGMLPPHTVTVRIKTTGKNERRITMDSF